MSVSGFTKVSDFNFRCDTCGETIPSGIINISNHFSKCFGKDICNSISEISNSDLSINEKLKAVQETMQTPLTEIEKKILTSLDQVTFLPASYDKRFCRSLSVDGLYTEKQRNYLHFVFNKYRRQIKNYEQLAFELEPERFDVKVKFESDLFSVDGSAEIEFKDTFKPSRFVNKK